MFWFNFWHTTVGIKLSQNLTEFNYLTIVLHVLPRSLKSDSVKITEPSTYFLNIRRSSLMFWPFLMIAQFRRIFIECSSLTLISSSLRWIFIEVLTKISENILRIFLEHSFALNIWWQFAEGSLNFHELRRKFQRNSRNVRRYSNQATFERSG